MFDSLRKLKANLGKKKKPSHIGIIIKGNINYARRFNISVRETYKISFKKVIDLIREQVKLDIPIMTINLLSNDVYDKEYFHIILDELNNFFDALVKDEFVHDNQIRFSIYGKWYDLPGSTVDKIKFAIENTINYDRFYVNFCIMYDGKKEIVDACKIIGRKIKADKLQIDEITEETIKDNIYNSFIAPDIIIKAGKDKRTNGFLLWDSPRSKIHFIDKYWPEFENKDFYKAIGY